MRILRRDDVSVNGNSGFGEKVTYSSYFRVGFGMRTGLADFRRGFDFEGGAAAIPNGKGRLKLVTRFEVAENWVWA